MPVWVRREQIESILLRVLWAAGFRIALSRRMDMADGQVRDSFVLAALFCQPRRRPWSDRQYPVSRCGPAQFQQSVQN